ncbi:MAG: ATP synthase F1 subunit delta [Terriglobia bacterium]
MAIAVANRYARALADVVSQGGDYRAVLGELRNFNAVYQESADLRDVFDTPAVSLEKKVKVLEAILARLEVSKATASFLRVLVTNYRIGMLGEICAAFAKIANERLGVVEVKVMSATGLTEAEQQALRARFEEVTRKQVAMDFSLDGGLLGGILARIQSTVYDGSVRGNLERIREQLLKR